MAHTLSSKDMKRLLDGLQDQGVDIIETHDGYRFLFPNGKTGNLHHTASDPRALPNQRANVIRNGLRWPLDVTDKKAEKRRMRDNTNAEMERFLEVWLRVRSVKDGFTTSDITTLVPLNYKTVVAWLEANGYEKRGGYGGTWHRIKVPTLVTTEPGGTGDEPAAEVPGEDTPPSATERLLPELKLEMDAAREGREFIDTHNSRALDLDEIPNDIPMYQLDAMIHALGYSYEIRVWKETN